MKSYSIVYYTTKLYVFFILFNENLISLYNIKISWVFEKKEDKSRFHCIPVQRYHKFVVVKLGCEKKNYNGIKILLHIYLCNENQIILSLYFLSHPNLSIEVWFCFMSIQWNYTFTKISLKQVRIATPMIYYALT